MDLKTYLDSAKGISASDLAIAVGASVPQVQQWKHGYCNRKPSPAYCVSIERATDGAVTRRDLRPNDWAQIWPELAEPEIHGTAQQEVNHG